MDERVEDVRLQVWSDTLSPVDERQSWDARNGGVGMGDNWRRGHG